MSANGPPSSSPDPVAADPSSLPLVPFSLLPAIALTIPSRCSAP